MVTAAGLFLAGAAIILTGFFASFLAQKGRFPELLVLIFLGFLLGPLNTFVFRVEPVASAIEEIPFASITPIFGALALTLIMFDAGLALRVEDVKAGLGRAAVHTSAVFALTVLAAGLVARHVLGFPWLIAFLLGAALGGVSSAVVLSVVRQIQLDPATRSLLTLECLLVDVFAVATAVALVEALRGGALDGARVAQGLATSLAVALVVGTLLGLALAVVLPRLRDAANLYILALGVLLGAYALIEILGGSGAIGVLALGIAFANVEPRVAHATGEPPRMWEEIGHVHGQASFLVRTFFFVLLGLTFSVDVVRHARDLESGASWLAFANGTMGLLVLGLLGLFAAIVIPRFIVARFTVPNRRDRVPSALVVGRGLGAAVLATLPFSVAEYADATTPYHAALAPYESLFPTLTSVLVVASVVTTAVGASIYARKWTPVAVADARAPPAPKPPAR